MLLNRIDRRTALPLLLATALLLAALPAAALEDEHRGTLAAGLDRTAYAAGDAVRLASVLTVEEGWHVNAHVPTYDYLIPTQVTLRLPAGWAEAETTYPDSKSVLFAFADEPLDVYEGRVAILSRLSVPEGTAAGEYEVGVELLYQACDHDSCVRPVTAKETLTLVVGPGGAAQNEELFAAGGGKAAGGGGGRNAGGTSIAWMLLLGVFGGLILNVMPCVLPVLSIKVFGLVKSAGLGRSQVVTGSLATTAGILASFWVLALFAIGARAAGAAVGWGVQFQQPAFVTLLAIVVVLFCLNLWGLFEIPLPARLATSLGGGGPREGLAGHFVSGLFATLMATPCSAPFLGTAVGFALAQPAAVIFAVFTAVGVGMALPYLLLAVAPGAAKLLPKPGAWMETVRRLMGFLLAASAVWLFYVLAAQVPAERLAAIQLSLLALALFVWMRHRGVSGAWAKRAAAVGMAGAVAASFAFSLGDVGGPVVADDGKGGLVPWVTFDRTEAESLAAGGQLVFVDVTADWCFTCKTNERLVLETEETAGLFERHGVVPMKADWTNRDDEIADFLADHGKYSIPFYLLYRPGDEPLPFSEFLTKGNLRQAVEEAAGAQTARLD